VFCYHRYIALNTSLMDWNFMVYNALVGSKYLFE
jgi:hypothetical protein